MIIRVFQIDLLAPVGEVNVKPGTTVQELRFAIERMIAEEEMCLVRVFTRWYLDVIVGNSNKKKRIEITQNDDEDTIESIGITDYSEIFLQGPIIHNHEGVGQALAMVNADFRQHRADQHIRSDQIAQVLDRLVSMEEAIADRQQHLAQLAIDGQQLILREVADISRSHGRISRLKEAKEARYHFINDHYSSHAQLMREEDKTYRDLLNEFHTGRTLANVSVYVRAAKVAFLAHPNEPLRALWSILNDTFVRGPEVAVAIVMDPCCGVELAAEGQGVFENKLKYVVGHGATPMLLAAHANRLDVVKSFVELGADVRVADVMFQVTPLHCAAVNHNVDMINFLFSRGANANVSTNRGGTPLHWAAECGDFATMEALVAGGADVKVRDINSATPLKRFENNLSKSKVESADIPRVKALLTPKG